MDVERMCGKPIRLFGTHRDTPNAHSTPSMQHIFTHKKKHAQKHTCIFSMHTQTWYTHGWCQPNIQWTLCSHLYLVEEFKFFSSAYQLFNNLSAIASCITVCHVSQPLPLMFKRFSKTNISFLLRKLDPISFSSALLIKGRLGNLILSNPKKENGLYNNKLTTPRVYSILILLCVFVHLCVFDVYARCCVYFLLSLCFLFVYIMLCLFMHFVCFLFCVCTAAFCPCMPFTQLRGFPKHPRLPLIPNSTFSNFRSNGPVLVIPRLSIRSTDFSYLLKCSPR